mmetsp:Transcript_44595/g.123683  ORF Transcript_44595/g.123683 Transcript_44595/m.123683 type:complete len:202 (-) Transcript_44595:284-889(-)
MGVACSIAACASSLIEARGSSDGASVYTPPVEGPGVVLFAGWAGFQAYTSPNSVTPGSVGRRERGTSVVEGDDAAARRTTLGRNSAYSARLATAGWFTSAPCPDEVVELYTMAFAGFLSPPSGVARAVLTTSELVSPIRCTRRETPDDLKTFSDILTVAATTFADAFSIFSGSEEASPAVGASALPDGGGCTGKPIAGSSV